MPRANRLFCFGYMMLLAVACRDAAAPGTPRASPAFATASDTTSRYLISYSSFLGGSGDDGGLAIAVDAAGNMYVVGYTYSSNFPTAGALQPARHGQANDAFVTKVNPVTGLVYSTYLGGTDPDPLLGETATGIALDAQGDAYVTGRTYSTSFPTTAGAFQTTFGGVEDGFVAELNPSGSALVYSTYLGGAGIDAANGIAIDAAGNAYVTGVTNSTNFPTTPGALQTVFGGVNDAFVTALSPAGSSLVYSTYLGGTGGEGANGIAVDGAGNAYVTGSTATGFPTTPGVVQSTPGGGGEGFVTALNAAGSALIYSTYLGGSGGDKGNKITVDAAGNAYVTGNTNSTDFPTTPSAFQTTLHGGNDAFVTALNSSGSALLYSTFLGGTGTDLGNGIALDAAGNLYLVGTTSSRDFPTTGAVVPADTGGGSNDAFVTALTSTGSALLFSTYLGGTGNDVGVGIAVDTAGTAYVTGTTGNLGANDFPITPGAFQPLFGGINDAYVTRITRVATPAGASMRP